MSPDLTLHPCFVVKQGNVFAHGKTLREAQSALTDKLFEDMGEDERISMFLDHFNLIDKYPATDFFDWHHKLTGSCKLGRLAFVKDHGIDLDKDRFTVDEFISLTENSYNARIIKKLKEQICKEEG